MIAKAASWAKGRALPGCTSCLEGEPMSQCESTRKTRVALLRAGGVPAPGGDAACGYTVYTGHARLVPPVPLTRGYAAVPDTGQRHIDKLVSSDVYRVYILQLTLHLRGDIG